MRQDASTAGAYTSIDGRAGMAKLIAHAAARASILMESAMRGPSEFLEPLQLYHEAGYRVGVAILAVPAARSRLQALRDSAAARPTRVFDPTSWILTTPVRRIGGPATGTGEDQRPHRSSDREQRRGRGVGR